MSQNIYQVYQTNPITSNASTDLMYFGQSPYGATDDAAMTYANFNAQIVVTGTLNALGYYATAGNKLSPITTANSAVLVTSSAGLPAYSATMTNGQLIIGSTSATPTAATLTAGTGISIANGAASITISSSTGVTSWVAASSTPITASVNTGYYITDASTVTITLPAVAAAGSVVSIVGNGAGGWILAPGSGQTIKVVNQSASTSVASAEQYDCIEVLCTVANTAWVARSLATTGFTIS